MLWTYRFRVVETSPHAIITYQNKAFIVRPENQVPPRTLTTDHELMRHEHTYTLS